MEGLIAKQSLNSQKKQTMSGYRYQIYSIVPEPTATKRSSFEMWPEVLENMIEKSEHWQKLYWLFLIFSSVIACFS